MAAEGPRPGRLPARVALLLLLLALVLVLAGLLATVGLGEHGAQRARVLRPSRLSPPAITGVARLGRRLRASRGRWSHRPLSYTYSWRRCNASGTRCRAIRHATRRTHVVAAVDVGSTLRVSVIAANAAGRSQPALSAHTAVVRGRAPTTGSGVQRLEYVFDDGLISVYDIDRAFSLVKTISLPQTDAGIRGATGAPSTHMLFISYGGDGGGNGNGSVLAYDLLAERVVSDVRLPSGIDSGAVSPDASRLYMPSGENSASGIWNILNTANGAIVGTIRAGAGPHNTIASADGRFVYLGGRNHNYLGVYETASGRVREVGPLAGGVRPFTVNGSNTLAFTTATGVAGFQVSNIASGQVLFSISFGPVPAGFPYTAPSHGISLSPDERQLYVIDAVRKLVRAYDVSGVAHGVAPRELGAIHVAGWNGRESPCAYDCGQDGWLQHSLDGRYVFVGDSGEVIETATRRVIATLPTLANTRKSLEINWQNGAPQATSGRTGVGYVP